MLTARWEDFRSFGDIIGIFQFRRFHVISVQLNLVEQPHTFHDVRWYFPDIYRRAALFKTFSDFDNGHVVAN